VNSTSHSEVPVEECLNLVDDGGFLFLAVSSGFRFSLSISMTIGFLDFVFFCLIFTFHQSCSPRHSFFKAKIILKKLAIGKFLQIAVSNFPVIILL